MVTPKIDDRAAMAKLRASLKEADRATKTAITKSFNKAAEEFRAAYVEKAMAKLPKRGGFAKIVATSKFDVRKRFGGPSPSLWLVAKRAKKGGQIDLRSVNRGRLRHPVRQRSAEKEAGRRVWVSQEIPPGFFDEATQKAGRATTVALQRALHQAAAEVGD